MANVTFHLLELNKEGRPEVFVTAGNVGTLLIRKDGIKWFAGKQKEGKPKKGRICTWRDMPFLLYKKRGRSKRGVPISARRIVLEVLRMDEMEPVVLVRPENPKAIGDKTVLGTLRIGRQGVKWLQWKDKKAQRVSWVQLREKIKKYQPPKRHRRLHSGS